ncbi:hypothetical protein B0H14DRAFT_3454301 [Mycena olivaceomarginata]|nr:hypothetical protein B0H14DRAFT_3454301 [Mycena olivaceomarginata]
MNGHHSHSAHSEAYQCLAQASQPAYPTPTNFHRGTYTSHSSIKKGNRHLEILLRDVEHVATLASLTGKKNGMDYDDTGKLYEEVREAGEKMLDDALGVILGGHTRVPGMSSATELNQLVARAFRGRWKAVGAGGAAGHGAVGFTHVSVYTNGGDHFVLRNASVQLTISCGRITSLLDVQLGHELIQEGATGGLVIFEDRLNYWDAWNFARVSVVAQGSLCASIWAELVYGQSRIDVTISLDAVPASTKLNSRSMFHFDAWVDWCQRHAFLKCVQLSVFLQKPRAFYTALRKNEAYAQLSSSPRFFHVFAEFVLRKCRIVREEAPRFFHVFAEFVLKSFNSIGAILDVFEGWEGALSTHTLFTE